MTIVQLRDHRNVIRAPNVKYQDQENLFCTQVALVLVLFSQQQQKKTLIMNEPACRELSVLEQALQAYAVMMVVIGETNIF